ncbi:MAG: cell division protein FtsZ, partial [Candidatus Sumerlaeia bacterium]|nr:cell division protein FtsZ [Candidatus Sumerlaeia bacterium]
MPLEFDQDVISLAKIKVIGVGGGGCNMVESMVDLGLGGVEFCGINTDAQALARSRTATKIQIGQGVTNGLGAGADPAVGERAAMDASEQLREILRGGDMVFITAGLGGGTGTGAAPVMAQLAKEMGILTVAVVTKPFRFEGPQRLRRAQAGIDKLRQFCDTLIVISNDRLIEVVGPDRPLLEAFAYTNQVLAQGVKSISDLISVPGLINVDFADVRAVMNETGGAVMGVGVGKGENRAVQAVKRAVDSPLLEKMVIDGAKGVLICITGGPDMTLYEINEATSMVYESADPDANIIFGAVIDEKLKDEIHVTIIATGFADDAPRGSQQAPRSGAAAQERLRSPSGMSLRTKLESIMSRDDERDAPPG